MLRVVAGISDLFFYTFGLSLMMPLLSMLDYRFMPTRYVLAKIARGLVDSSTSSLLTPLGGPLGEPNAESSVRICGCYGGLAIFYLDMLIWCKTCTKVGKSAPKFLDNFFICTFSVKIPS